MFGILRKNWNVLLWCVELEIIGTKSGVMTGMTPVETGVTGKDAAVEDLRGGGSSVIVCTSNDF
jgi:hypothetical protein